MTWKEKLEVLRKLVNTQTNYNADVLIDELIEEFEKLEQTPKKKLFRRFKK